MAAGLFSGWPGPGLVDQEAIDGVGLGGSLLCRARRSAAAMQSLMLLGCVRLPPLPHRLAPVPGDPGEATDHGETGPPPGRLHRLAPAPPPGSRQRPTGRAAIGRPSRNRSRSSASCQAVS